MVGDSLLGGAVKWVFSIGLNRRKMSDAEPRGLLDADLELRKVSRRVLSIGTSRAEKIRYEGANVQPRHTLSRSFSSVSSDWTGGLVATLVANDDIRACP